MSCTALFIITMYATGCDTKPGALTKAGILPVIDFTVAADPRVLPIGTIIEIEGFTGPRLVHDIGGKVKGKHVDLFVGSCSTAINWGRRTRAVRVLHLPRKRP